MLAKITSKNQVTIPKKIMDQLPGVQYMEMELIDGVIRMKPVKTSEIDLENIRTKMKRLNLNVDSVSEAIKWARDK